MANRAITSAQFKKALSTISLTKGQRKFLQAHYRSVGRVATMSNLAKAAGYKSYGGVDLQYGRLAKRIAKVTGRAAPKVKVSLLVAFVRKGAISNKNWVIHMRPAFARALRSAGIVR